MNAQSRRAGDNYFKQPKNSCVPKLSKAKAAKQKRAEKVARAAEAASSEDAALRCKVCGLLCPSKNQLFKHIKQTGHAAFK